MGRNYVPAHQGRPPTPGYIDGSYIALGGIALENYNREYNLMKYFRKTQTETGKKKKSDHASTVQPVPALPPLMLTEKHLRGMHTDQERQLANVDPRVYGPAFLGEEDEEEIEEDPKHVQIDTETAPKVDEGVHFMRGVSGSSFSLFSLLC